MPNSVIPRVGWDATVCIDFLEEKESQKLFLRPIVEDAEAGKIVIVLSAMAIVETLRLKDVDDTESDRKIRAFFDQSYVYMYAFESFIAERTRDIRRVHKLDPADAVHVGTAAFADCDWFLTDDGNAARTVRNVLLCDKLIASGELSSGKMLRVVTPEQYHQAQLIAKNPILTELDHSKAGNGKEEIPNGTADTDDTVSEVRSSDAARPSDAKAGNASQPAEEASGNIEAKKEVSGP